MVFSQGGETQPPGVLKLTVNLLTENRKPKTENDAYSPKRLSPYSVWMESCSFWAMGEAAIMSVITSM